MLGLTITILIMLILIALLSSAIGSEITIELGTLLWIILACLIFGAVWMVMLFVSSVGDGIRRWRD